MRNKGISLVEIIMIVSILFVVGVLIYAFSTTEFETTEFETTSIEYAECEHDYVITSKYDWLFEQYKTISKCTKCGKEI